ncbi:MAG: hypothetical protein DRG83_07425 [Deltaproteobacteria bacterium]|nr:MAG: hypothetical protein DRG83_07425 [Deltaproteobacteria bacterium]
MPKVRWWPLAIAIGGFLLPLFAFSQPYADVASALELGMGARPLAMGGAFVGLADDVNALFFNPAGLARIQGFPILSSYEVRPGTASYGHLSAAISGLGLGIHYFDFGKIPETDEFGNVTGYFSYRDYFLIAGAGLSLLKDIPLLGEFDLGATAKYVKVSTLASGSGSGAAFDLAFLFGGNEASFAQGFLTDARLGVVLENLVGLPLTYKNGHQETWPRPVIMGASAEFYKQWTLAVDFAPARGVRFGLEWRPISGFALRAGLRGEGVPIWSLGIGVSFNAFTLDYALVVHPYLAEQHRLSLAFAFRAFSPYHK